MQIPQSAFGVAAKLAKAWIVSEQRLAFPWRIVCSGLLPAFVLAALYIKIPVVAAASAALAACSAGRRHCSRSSDVPNSPSWARRPSSPGCWQRCITATIVGVPA
jgi:hypothetical protein